MASGIGVSEWIQNPLQVIQQHLENSSLETRKDPNNDWGVSTSFEQVFQDPKQRLLIPSLNNAETQYLGNNSLVRFRGMVSDMGSTEFFLGYCEEKLSQGGIKPRTCKYRDYLDVTDQTAVDLNHPNNSTCCRFPITSVAIPGETAWTKELLTPAQVSPYQTNQISNNSTPNGRPKRRRDEEAPMELESDTNMNGEDPEEELTSSGQPISASNSANNNNNSSSTSSSSLANKRVRENDTDMDTKCDPGLAHASDTLTVACKLYHIDEESIKIADYYEFFGVLSNDPLLTSAYSEFDEPDGPPGALRLHVIYMNKLDMGFPLVSHRINSSVGYQQEVANTKTELSQIRSSLVSYIAQTLNVPVDHFIPELVLLHLLSGVAMRRMGRIIGKLSLNLCVPVECTEEQKLSSARVLCELYSSLLPKLQALSLTLDGLSKKPIYPVKDYEKNLITESPLQLSEGTILFLDEMSIKAGNLNSVGVTNIGVIQTLMKDQTLEYDFNYHKAAFPVNNPVVSVSCGKALLPSDLRLRLPGPLATALPPVDGNTLMAWRRYLLLARQGDFEPGDNLIELLREGMTEERKRNPGKQANEEMLHFQLTVARLTALSYLETAFDSNRWGQVKSLVSRFTDAPNANTTPPQSVPQTQATNQTGMVTQ